MYSLARTGLALLVALLSLGLPCSQARFVENWSYERLFKESDVIVIAEAMSVEDSGGTTKIKPWDVDFVGVHSTFAVKAKLKGKLDKDQLTVLHYRVEKDVKVENGPGLVSFRLKGIEGKSKEVRLGLGKPEYLLFLKHEKDDCYEPVSGQKDPRLSVREMYGASTANLLDGISK